MAVAFDPDQLLRQTDWLRSLAAQLVRDAHVADDAVQDTCVAALLQPRLASASEPGMRAWLARVLRHTIALRHRRDGRRQRREVVAARAEPVPAVSESIERAATQRALLDAVLRLPPDDRDVVVLRYFEALAPRQIAARLGTTSASVRSRLSRALGKLRAQLDAGHGGDGRSYALALAGLLPRGVPLPEGLSPTLAQKGLVAGAAMLVVLGIAAWWSDARDARLDPGQAAAPSRVAPELVVVPHAAVPAPVPADGVRAPIAAPMLPRGPTRKPQGTTLVALLRCVDPAGRPIAGARVSAADVVDRPTVTTGGDGRARLELAWPAKLTYGNAHWIFLEATGDDLCRVRRQEAASTAAPIQFGDVVLTPGGAIHGRVLGDDGTAAAGVYVALVAPTRATSGAAEEERRVLGRGFQGLGGDVMINGRTDAKGDYRFDGVPVGDVSVLARSPGHYSAYTDPVPVVWRGDAEAPDLRLTAVRAEHTIAGLVRDAAGEPMPGASLSVYLNRAARNIDAVARARAAAPEGRFRLVVPAGNKYSVTVEDARDPTRFLLVHDVDAGTAALELTFPPERAVVVVAQDAAGVRIAEPTWMLADVDGYALHTRTRPGGDGETLLSLPAVPFRLSAGAAGYVHATVGPFEPRAVTAPIRVTLQRAGMLRGRVTAGGAPVAGAKLHVHAAPAEPRLRFAGGLRTRLDQAMRSSPVLTDGEGRFAMPVAAAGRFVLHADADGYARAASAPLAVQLGQPIDGIELVLLPGAVLTGRVLVAPGVETQGMLLGATCGDGHVHLCLVDAEGRYELTGLAAGGWQVQRCEPRDQEWLRSARTWPAPAGAAPPADVELRSGATATFDLDLRAQEPARVRGMLTLGGAPASGWSVTLSRAGAFVSGRTDGEGRFEVATSGAGAATLWCSTSGIAGGQLRVGQPLTLAAGDNDWRCDLRLGSVDLHGLRPGAAAAGEAGQQRSYALVWADLGHGRQAQLTFLPDASANFAASVPVGQVELRCQPAARADDVDAWPVLATFVVRAGETTRFTPGASDVSHDRSRRRR